MLGTGYTSKQIYSYEDFDKLENILKITNCQNYKIHEEENVIEYTIDRRLWIRLSDLIYWIEQDFIRIYFGQFLDLLENILNYIQFLIDNNIQHDYLDSDRIWLILQQGSDVLNVVPKKLIYNIQFTGYQCKFYEKNDKTSTQQNHIYEMFISIIMNFMKNEILIIEDKSKKNQVLEIYKELVNSVFQQNIKTTINFIQSLKIKYDYNQENQMITLDQKVSKYSTRESLTCSLDVQINKLLNSLNGQNQIYTEYALKILVPLYVKPLNSLRDQLLDKIPQFDQTQLEDFKNILNKQQNEINDFIKEQLDTYLKDQITKSQNQFKFEFPENEQNNMKSTIFQEISNKKLFKYFENSIWYQKLDETQSRKISLSSQMIKKMIEEQFEIFLEQKLLELQDDLI